LNLWDQLQELAEVCADYEIENPHHISFIVNLFSHTTKETIYDDLTEKQMGFLNALYERYCNEDFDAYQEWIEETTPF